MIQIEREKLEKVLDALEMCTNQGMIPMYLNKNKEAITIIKDVLACKYGNEPKSCTSNPMDCQCAIDAAQKDSEPVAWLSIDSIGERYLCFDKPLDNDSVQPLYIKEQP